MKMQRLFIGAAVLAVACSAQGGKAVDDSQLGLVKQSVYDTPTPAAPDYAAPAPGTPVSEPPRYFPGAPPVVPHSLTGMMPITAQNNSCLGCHDKPEMIGKAVEGVPTPMPKSHYADTWAKTASNKLSGARYNCTQCHAEQADAQPLVNNTGGPQ